MTLRAMSAIDSHVKNLRAKLIDDPRNPRWLFTVLWWWLSL